MAVPSKYQQAIYDWVEMGAGSAVVDAVAGSGKTFTIIEATKKIPGNQSVVMLAFNKRAADDLKAKAPRYVSARTFHSLGFEALRNDLGKQVRVEGDKVWKLCKESLSYADFKVYGLFIVRLVGFAKAIGMDTLVPNVREEWEKILTHQGLDLNDPDGSEERGIHLAMDILEDSNWQAKRQRVVDFDDQIYLPTLWDLPVPQYDWVFIDEAQDTNPVRRELAKKALRLGGRLVAVGDPHQAIYGFTGATPDAMDHIERGFAAQRFPLSVNYRCGSAIIERAQKLVPQLEAWDKAGPGEVVDLPDTPDAEQLSLRELTSSDVILCRFTAPLVEAAYWLIGEGVGCRIFGRDIGVGLIVLVNKIGADTLEELFSGLEQYRNKEVGRLLQRDQEDRARTVEDKVGCLLVIMGNVDSIDEVVPAIEQLFSDSEGNLLTLSTVHKAKGGEWPTVAVIRHSQMPCRWAKRPWQREQEQNLIYVAYTRAKDKLILIP